MPGVLLFYLLCSLSHCPPPPVLKEVPKQVSNLRWDSSWSLEVPQPKKYQSQDQDKFPNSNIKAEQEYLVVSTVLGSIQGRFMWSRDHRKFRAFEGIPYALPPVGQLRFRDPLPVNKIRWEGGFLLANKTGEDCLQLDFTRNFQVRGGEDCLFLNVYAPAENQKKPSELVPVLIWVHGGAFISNSGSQFGPRYLLDKDIILVTLNYRLGVLGFLSTGDTSSRGNFALKDQLAAFIWVIDHISSFGGDPQKITLIGESAGATSIALHLISPLTSEKIPRLNGAILLSASKFNYFEMRDNETISNTKLLAKRMNCPSKGPSQSLVDCLRTRDPHKIVAETYHLWRIPVFFRLLFGPVVEENHEGAFLVQSPKEAYQSSRIMRVPVIAGITKDEGSFFTSNIYRDSSIFNKINKHWEEMMAYLMQYDNAGGGGNVQEISRKIGAFYFHGKMEWSHDNLDGIIKVLGDRLINTGVHSFLQLHSQVAPTFPYLFTHSSSNLSSIKSSGLTGNEQWGVTHTDELPLIFSMERFPDESSSEDDLKVSRFLVNTIYNFARDGKPLGQQRVNERVVWKAIRNESDIEVMEVNKERRVVPFPYLERIKFWEELRL